jgi:hypothetical protein
MFRSLTTRRLPRALLGVAAAAILASGGAFAGFGIASAAGSTTFYACVTDASGAVRIVTATTTCSAGEHKVNWNQTGPQGPAGRDAASPVPYQLAVGTVWIDGLTGPNPDGSVDLRSVAEVVKRAAGSTGKPSFGEMGMTKVVDSSSPQILRFAATGTHIAKAKVTLFKPGGRVTLATYELDQVIVTLDDVGHDGAATATQLEKMSLSFAKFKVTIGTRSFAWDVLGGKEI